MQQYFPIPKTHLEDCWISIAKKKSEFSSEQLRLYQTIKKDEKDYYHNRINRCHYKPSIVDEVVSLENEVKSIIANGCQPYGRGKELTSDEIKEGIELGILSETGALYTIPMIREGWRDRPSMDIHPLYLHGEKAYNKFKDAPDERTVYARKIREQLRGSSPKVIVAMALDLGIVPEEMLNSDKDRVSIAKVMIEPITRMMVGMAGLPKFIPPSPPWIRSPWCQEPWQFRIAKADQDELCRAMTEHGGNYEILEILLDRGAVIQREVDDPDGGYFETDEVATEKFRNMVKCHRMMGE